jgi:electron transfer flavoprotein beta subunit
MKILVPVKRVVDANVNVQVRADGTGMALDGVKMSMNPFDEIAVEEAVRLKERGVASEIVAVSIGPAKAQDVLRTAMAIGADRAVLVETETETQPLAVAKMLAVLARREAADLVLMGKQAIDDDMNATGQMLAALLGWPQAVFASRVEIEDGRATVTCEVDAGLKTVSVALPAVVTADLRLNEPRYASLPNIMKAKKKPLDVLTPGDLGVDPEPRLQILRVDAPPRRAPGVMVGSISELVAKLKSEAKVI